MFLKILRIKYNSGVSVEIPECFCYNENKGW